MKFVSRDPLVLAAMSAGRDRFKEWSAKFEAMLAFSGLQVQEVDPVVGIAPNGDRVFLGLRSTFVDLSQHEMSEVEGRANVFMPNSGTASAALVEVMGVPPSPWALLPPLGMPVVASIGPKRATSPSVDFSEDGESVEVVWDRDVSIEYDESKWILT